MKNILPIFFVFSLTLFHCDKGLSPFDTDSGFAGISGTIYFKNWPPADSLFDIRIVAFREFPPLDIASEVISGRAIIFPDLSDTSRIPFYIDSLQYTMALEKGIFEYLAVAHQFGPNFFNDWQAAGQYDITPQDSLPSSIFLEEGELITDILIYVDFDSLPMQPF
jgi:hypothetical protein